MCVRPCQRWHSHHHNTFLTSFKYSESCVQNSKKICGKLCGKYAAKFASLLALASCQQFGPGAAAARAPWQSPGKPLCTLPTEGVGGILEFRTFTYRPACCLTKWPVAQWGRPFTKQCNLTYAGQWAGRIPNRSIG